MGNLSKRSLANTVNINIKSLMPARSPNAYDDESNPWGIVPLGIVENRLLSVAVLRPRRSLEAIGYHERTSAEARRRGFAVPESDMRLGMKRCTCSGLKDCWTD